MADSVTQGVNTGSNAMLSCGTRDQSGDGAAIVTAPSDGYRVRVREIYFWLSDLADSNSVTIKIGALVLPAIPLGSSAAAFSMYRAIGEHILAEPNSAVYLSLSGTDQVAFMCMYDLV